MNIDVLNDKTIITFDAALYFSNKVKIIFTWVSKFVLSNKSDRQVFQSYFRVFKLLSNEIYPILMTPF